MAKATKSPLQKGISALLEEDVPQKKAPKKAAPKKSPAVTAEKPTEAPPVMLNLKLDQIKIDPNNPRKTFDESEMDQLIESVRENGILQPIIVRPMDDDYHFIIIAGERRYRAAAAVATAYKYRNNIPVIVMNAASEERSLELQIVENIQRADMHPIEEAQAIQKLYYEFNELAEIAAKIGKSVYYVRQRMKLNSLSDDWVAAYKKGDVNHATALKLSRMTPDSQKEIYESEYRQKPLEIKDHVFNRHNNSLADAHFDQDADYEGLPKCNSCPYNSAYNSLFPGEEKAAYCKNNKCFGLKKAYAFDLALSSVKDDPGTVMIADKYNLEKEDLESWMKNDMEVYRSLHFTELEPPAPYNYDLDPEQYEPDEAEDLKMEQERYAHDLKEYEEDLKKPNLLKALVMNGSCKGDIQYGFLDPNPELITSDKNGSSKNAATATQDPGQEIKDEIERIKSKEKRSKELDGEKIWSNVTGLLEYAENRSNVFNYSELTNQELYAAASAICQKMGYQHSSWIREYFGDTSDRYTYEVPKEISSEMLCGLLRMFICDVLVTNYGSHLKKNSQAAIAFPILQKYLPKEIADFESEQKEIAKKRQKRVNERLAALKKKMATG